VNLTFTLYNADGTVNYQSVRTLQTRHRVALELSELLDGIAPPPGSSVVVTSSAPIDAFALIVDEGTGTISPVLPLESRQ
jgi:hypothetical protein